MAKRATLEMNMKNTGNNGASKIIAGLLAVIAVCMVSIVVLLSNMPDIDSTQETENAATKEYVTENSNDNSTEHNETAMSGNNGTTAQGTGYNPYYKYEGELSEVPITPTEVENADILDKIITKDTDVEEFEEYKAALINHILDVASEYEVYANPTIVEDGIMMWSIEHGMIVDLHTKNNDFLTVLDTCAHVMNVHTDSPKRQSRIFSLNDEKSTPVMYGSTQNIYVFNRVDLYNGMLDFYDTPEETKHNADEYEKLIVETSLEWIKNYQTSELIGKEPLTEEQLATINFGYLQNWSLIIDDDGNEKCIYFSFAMKGANNLYISVSGCIDKNKKSYAEPDVSFNYLNIN